MKFAVTGLLLLLGLGNTAAQAQFPQPNPFKHIVVIVQENRTPDNLFQGLLTWPGINPANYDIQSTCLAKVNGKQVSVPLTPVDLGNDYDPSHKHAAWEEMWDQGAMDGAYLIPDICNPGASDCTNNGQGQFLSYKYVQNIVLPDGHGILDPYLTLAAQYGWANAMFQTNQGPSYPAHQFLFGGTSAQDRMGDLSGIFVAENPKNPSHDAGCLAALNEYDGVISPSSAPNEYRLVNNPLGAFCFHRHSMAYLLDHNQPQLGWKYYSPSVGGSNPGGSIWTAPNSIQEICQPNTTFTQCLGPEWTANVDLKPSDVLSDIAQCHLQNVSWVIPIGQNSDHAGNQHGTGGPAWVASIVNAIGNDKTCENKVGYWSDTAVVITWDDWGGWCDHVKPAIPMTPQGDYSYGFRVPLIVVSAYTPQAYVNNSSHDFGTVLRFIEGVFNIPEGSLRFADARANTDLQEFFNFNAAARPFQPIPADKGADFFLNDTRPPEPPDND